MKTGLILKSADVFTTDEDMVLINQYTRRQLSKDEVYIFSLVLCDNDIDRDFERFTVESLFELEKLFVGKTGIFDHNMSAKNQTARIFHCEVEAVDGKKTATGDDYFMLKAKAYIPKSKSNEDIILSIDSGIIKEVSVGCAVKSTVCSVCGNDINSVSCTHRKGAEYNGILCYGEMTEPLDAYEFSFVAVPAQKNAGVVKSYTHKKEKNTMKDILSQIKKCKEFSLKAKDCEFLCEYIEQLKEDAEYGKEYRKSMKKSLLKMMSVHENNVPVEVLEGIVDKLSLAEIKALGCSYIERDEQNEKLEPQLTCKKVSEKNKKSDNNNQFTI